MLNCFPHVEINNVESTLKIGCSTLQPKINLKPTLCADLVISIQKEARTDLWLSSTSDEEKFVRLFVGFPGSELSLSSTVKILT